MKSRRFLAALLAMIMIMSSTSQSMITAFGAGTGTSSVTGWSSEEENTAETAAAMAENTDQAAPPAEDGEPAEVMEADASVPEEEDPVLLDSGEENGFTSDEISDDELFEDELIEEELVGDDMVFFAGDFGENDHENVEEDANIREEGDEEADSVAGEGAAVPEEGTGESDILADDSSEENEMISAQEYFSGSGSEDNFLTEAEMDGALPLSPDVDRIVEFDDYGDEAVFSFTAKGPMSSVPPAGLKDTGFLLRGRFTMRREIISHPISTGTENIS